MAKNEDSVDLPPQGDLLQDNIPTERKETLIPSVDDNFLIAPNGSDEEILRKVEVTAKKLTTYLQYEKGSDKDQLFSIKSRGDNRFIVCPSNTTELLDIPHFRIIFSLITALQIPLEKGTEKLELSAASEEKRLFWGGFVNRILRATNTNTKHLNFTASDKSPNELGRACADAEIFLQYAGIPNAYNYLPETVKFGITKTKLLTAKINELVGFRAVSNLGQLPLRIAEAVRKLNNEDSRRSELALASKISLSQALQSLVRTKNITDRGKTRTVNIHLVRPSQKVEVASSSERKVLELLEEPWNELKKLTKEYEQGIPLTELEEVQSKYKKYYDKQFIVSERLVAWASTRRGLIQRHAAKGRKNVVITSKIARETYQAIIDRVFDEDCSDDDLKDFDQLNPKYLIATVGEKVPYECSVISGRNILTGGILKAIKRVENPKDSFDEIVDILRSFGNDRMESFLMRLTDEFFEWQSSSSHRALTRASVEEPF